MYFVNYVYCVYTIKITKYLNRLSNFKFKERFSVKYND
jgi:hypothetical protein